MPSSEPNPSITPKEEPAVSSNYPRRPQPQNPTSVAAVPEVQASASHAANQQLQLHEHRQHEPPGDDLGLPGVEMSQEAARQRFDRLPPAMQKYVVDRKRRLLQKYPGALEPGFVPPEGASVGGRTGFSLNTIANLFIFLAAFTLLAYMAHADYGVNLFEMIWSSLLRLLDPGFDAQRQAAVEARQAAAAGPK